ncbi:hypothetical protein BS17DRAFT_821035 [Gyrodon lividus]|nr:hypothetical protein BS17DRAFT_821035 [Gyrodon lividus]
MASLLTNLIPVFIGANWLAWYPLMELFLMAQGLYYVITDECPSPNEENDNATDIFKWNHHNTQAIGNICLHLTPNILAKVLSKTTAAQIWSTLKNKYGTPSIATTYAEFKAMLDMPIPLHKHPAPAFNAEFEISPKVQAMILLTKLLSSMDTISHLISQSQETLTSTTIKNSSPNNLPNREEEIAAHLARTKGKSSMVENCNQHKHNHLASTAITVPPMECSRLRTPVFETTLKAFDLLCQISITLSYKGVHTIKMCLPSDPALEAGPSAKHPRLEERISTSSFTAKDNAISMTSGYESNDIYNMYIDRWACEGELGDDTENNLSWQMRIII